MNTIKKISTLVAIAIVSGVTFLSMGCTDNTRAKAFGGTMTINLPAKEKLVNATWKEAQLWYLTRPMKDDEKAETLMFREKSGFGMLEGTVIFKESK